jgi:hypothetical protein
LEGGGGVVSATSESGHVILSSPTNINIGVGSSSKGYTEDWAVMRDRRFQG